MSRAGLRDVTKTTGSYLFSGPTELVKRTCSQTIFNYGWTWLDDMSEYMESHSVSRLIGAPPGYIGYDQSGVLTDAIEKNPYSLFLFDEIEKAHPDIYNILLQIMDYGSITDNNGKLLNFRNTILIMTTNGFRTNNQSPIGFERDDMQRTLK